MKKIIWSIILLTILIITSVTSYKVIKENNAKKIMVTEKRIIEAAKECWNTGKCTDDIVTLEKLYAEHLLAQEIDPITKEIYNIKSYVERSDNNYQFKIVS